jgi:hypothetical protein
LIELLIVRPRIRTELVVEFGQSRPSECKSAGRCDEISGHPKGGRRCEAFDAGLLIRVIADLPVNLVELIIGTVKRLEGD